MKTIGFIDKFDFPKTISGWARETEGQFCPKPDVVAFRGLNEIGRGIADIDRTDFKSIGDGKFGFEINLTDDVSHDDLLDGSVVLKAFVDSQHTGTLMVERRLAAAIEFTAGALKISSAFNKAPKGQGAAILQKANYIALSDRTAREALGSVNPLATALINSALRPKANALPSDGALSSVLLPTGLKSPDGTAVIGKNGTFYVIGGSGDVHGMYGRAQTPHLVHTKNRWVELFQSRSRRLKNENIRYVQIILPEKITAIPDLYPAEVLTPTTLLGMIEDSLQDDQNLRNSYISGAKCLPNSERRAAFRKIDSHLTPFGARVFAEKIAQAADYRVEPRPEFSRYDIIPADLGFRFFGINLYDEINSAEPPSFARERVKLDDYLPENGGHIGRRSVWSNPNAPINARVVAFGNSFMDKPELSTSLSYWLSCWFREFHQVFSPSIDFNYIANKHFDLVICQTIERYLRVSPVDVG